MIWSADRLPKFSFTLAPFRVSFSNRQARTRRRRKRDGETLFAQRWDSLPWKSHHIESSFESGGSNDLVWRYASLVFVYAYTLMRWDPTSLSYTYSNTPWMMGKTKKMDRGFLVSVGTPETAMNPDPKYALLTKTQYDPLNGSAQSKYGMIG